MTRRVFMAVAAKTPCGGHSHIGFTEIMPLPDGYYESMATRRSTVDKTPADHEVTDAVHTGNKYHRTIVGQSEETAVIDIYDILNAFPRACPAQQHALKKLLCPGLRGKGSEVQDLIEARDALNRAIKFAERRAGVVTATVAPDSPPVQPGDLVVARVTATVTDVKSTGTLKVGGSFGSDTYLGGRFEVKEDYTPSNRSKGFIVKWSVNHPSGTYFIASRHKEVSAALAECDKLNDDLPCLPITIMEFIESLPDELKQDVQ